MNILKITVCTLGAIAVLGSNLAFVDKGISITGSDTMLIMNQELAEAFQKQSGGSVAVRGGGSSIGINAFINGVTDICASSRKMRKSEIDKARSRSSVAFETPIALDGLAIVVNAKNPVSSLTMDEVRKIYIGQITNWKQVGGSDEAITVMSRDANSGTYGFVQQVVLKGQNWGPQVRFMPSTSEEGREVARTEGAVAYGGIAYFKGNSKLKVLAIKKAAGSPALAPTEANVRCKCYPIWRYLYYYFYGISLVYCKIFNIICCRCCFVFDGGCRSLLLRT
ncbi:MAG: phosphate ABC transporter substrate-binding protein [Armatimonadetes bacterium]|nr:phosphate ABC transporter substrate-binding protein [Armatimonadota bacterium]